MGLAVDPGIGNADICPRKPVDRSGGLNREVPVGSVDLDLRDYDGGRPVGPDRQG